MRFRKIALSIISAVMGLSLVAFSGVSFSIRNLENNITILENVNVTPPAAPASWESETTIVEEASSLEGREAIVEKYPLTILLVGSDTRVGQGNGFGKASGARSDTTIVVKMNAERTHAAVLSIARDLWVTIPECEKDSGGTLREQSSKFNAAYAFGGVNCMLATLEYNFGIQVNHVAVVDFLGFQNIVDVIGGVQVCVQQDVSDKSSGLNLKAGKQTLNGEQSLAFVRARKNIGDGSDISRSERQKMFLASMFNTAQNNGLFYNPPQLYKILDTISKSLSTDKELGSIDKMLELALDINKVGTKNIQFVYLPWQSRGDGSIEFKDEAMQIIESLNEGRLPLIQEPSSPEANDREEGTVIKNISEDPSSYDKNVFTADLDMCDANIK